MVVDGWALAAGRAIRAQMLTNALYENARLRSRLTDVMMLGMTGPSTAPQVIIQHAVITVNVGGDAARLDALENAQMSLAENVDTLRGEFDAFKVDVAAKIAAVEASAAQATEALAAADIPGAQAALETLTQDVAAAHALVGDANEDGVPAAPPVEGGGEGENPEGGETDPNA